MGDPPRILHVIARVVRRGGEVFAAELAEALSTHTVSRNLLFPLFGPPEGTLSAGVRIVPGARPRRHPERTASVDPGAVARMRLGLRRLKPDLVAAHGGQAFAYAVLADPRGRVPTVFRANGLPADAKSERMLARLLPRATSILAVNEGLRDELIERFGVDPDKVQLYPVARRTPQPMDEAERHAFRTSIGAKPDLPLMGWVGRLTDEKQPGVALQVFALVKERFGPCTLALCGDGPLQPAIIGAAVVAGEGALVLGSRDDPERLIASSDLLLSTSGAEGAPGVLIEAGLAGVPTVAFDVGDVSRILRDGETGVLAPPGFVEVMAVVVVDLLRDPEARARMGAAARAACAPFDLDRVAGTYAEPLLAAISPA